MPQKVILNPITEEPDMITDIYPIFINGNKVGIGTTGPVSALHVDGANSIIRVGPNYATGGDRDYVELVAHGTDTRVRSANERFHIENTGGPLVLQGTGGNVGIGTTSPVNLLTVGAPIDSEKGSTNYGTALIRGNNKILSNTQRGILDIEMDGVESQAQDKGGTLTFTNHVQNAWYDNANYVGVGLKAGKANSINTNQAAYLAISVNGGLSLGEAMRIDSTGNVGIGTTAPSARLDISGTVLSVGQAFVTEYNNGNVSGATTINWNSGNMQVMTLVSGATLTFTAPSVGVGRFDLRVKENASGLYPLYFPGSVIWPAGSVNWVASGAANLTNIITFRYDSDAKYVAMDTGWY